MVHVVTSANIERMKLVTLVKKGNVVTVVTKVVKIPYELNQQMHRIPILLVLLLYMLRANFLPINRSS